MTTVTTQAPVPVGLIAAEVRFLRKGRGLQAADLDRRLGPHLRELAASGAGGDMAVLRHSLSAEIGNCAARLAVDLRSAILASLALSVETRQMPHFKDRVSWLAASLGYEYRTALRRIDTAEQLLSEEIARELLRRRGRTATSPDGWYLEELRTLVRLDTATPEVHEQRKIVATKDGLSEVMAWMDVPRTSGQPGPGLTADILFGGRLIRREHPSGGRFQLIVQLPEPLQAGQTHEFGLLLTPRPMSPHYIFSPECQCNMFDVRVRFDLSRLPGWIRRVHGETVRMFDSARPGNDDLAAINDAGELHLQFNSPTMYLCYGVQWQR